MNDPNQSNIGDIPNRSAEFGSVQNDSEPFGNVPKGAEDFRTVRKISERTENHTLTVREVARLFESAGVPRTERSIVNWCQPNRMGVPRLDCYFDTNERRYFISRESVERAISEEQAKVAKDSEPRPEKDSLPHASAGKSEANSGGDDLGAMQRELRDLQITNRAKDMFIEQLQGERKEFVERIAETNRKVGQLETRLLQMLPEAMRAQVDSVAGSEKSH